MASDTTDCRRYRKKTIFSKEIFSLTHFNFLPQIYPRHKDIYNWIDIDQRVYVPYNISYLQESFNYVSNFYHFEIMKVKKNF